MEALYLPVLSHFQNGNFWTGSERRLRYRIVPEDGQLAAEAWEGPWSYALSQVEDRQTFPRDQEGLDQLASWIQTWSQTINARPPRTLEETIQARDARQQAEQDSQEDG